MKTVTLLLCALALGFASPAPRKKADKKFLEKQQNLLQLFVNVQQPNYNQQQQQIGNNFDLRNQQDQFSNSLAVKQFQNAYKQGLLARGQVFNYYNPNQLQQAIQLFDVFYFAKDFDTFYQAACWARDRVNEVQFVYALSVAIVKRKDTQGIALPPQSEIFPHLYVNTQAIQQAQNYKQQGKKTANVQSNTTGNYQFPYLYQQKSNGLPFNVLNSNPQDQNRYDARISYFSEDKNLNQLFAFQQINYPNWFNEEKYGLKWQKQNGERFYYYLQQLLARYNLEKHANDMPNVQPLQFNQNIQPGYNPELQYHNGQAMPARPNNININNANSKNLQELQNLDRRIADAVDSQLVENNDGSYVKLDADTGAEVLGNLVQANTNSENNQFYASNNGLYGYLDIFRRVVGSIVDPTGQYQTAPGTIENESAACRDPVFYQIISRVINYFQSFKNQQQPYKQEELNFQGVQVQSVDLDKLVTYFDQSQVDLYNAINYQQGEQAENYQYQAQQQRLNNEPFDYNIQVKSEQNTDAIVRVFIGPQADEQGQRYNLEQAREHFVEIDRFVAQLKSGQNSIKRNSQQSSLFVDEQTGARFLLDQVQQAQRGGQPFYITEGHNTQQASFPQNLLLPRGSRQGRQYAFFVAVNHHDPSDQKLGQNVNPPNDARAQGFPLDRPTRAYDFQHTNNFYFKTVTVFHKDQKNINRSRPRPWAAEELVLSI